MPRPTERHQSGEKPNSNKSMIRLANYSIAIKQSTRQLGHKKSPKATRDLPWNRLTKALREMPLKLAEFYTSEQIVSFESRRFLNYFSNIS